MTIIKHIKYRSFFILNFTIIILSFYYLDIFGITNQNSSYSINQSADDVSNNKSALKSFQFQEHNVKNTTNMNNLNLISVDILTDRKEYTEMEAIKIMLKFYGGGSDYIKLILEARNSSNIVIHKSSQVVHNITDYDFFLHPGKNGVYNVTVKAIQGSNFEIASTNFNVISIFETNTLKFLYLSLIIFSVLLIFVTIGIKNRLIDEILRFVLLSGIVASLLASLLFTDIEFGTQSPLGLIKQPANESQNFIWVFHIGNQLKIPVFVIVFGLIGGYIRYLYKTSKLIDEVKEEIYKSKSKNSSNHSLDKNIKNENSKNLGLESEKTRINIFYESLRDVALFFLAPILSVAVYFLLFAFGLSGDNSIYTLAVISFTVGLVTEDIIQTLIKFTLEKLSNKSKTNISNGTKN